MKTLAAILAEVPHELLHGKSDTVVQHITLDSRAIREGSLFLAVKGTQADGHRFIAKAIEQGAVAIIGEQMPDQLPDQVAFVAVKDSAQAAGKIAAAFYAHPSRELKMVAVTGTNGKTTTATLLYRLFTEMGYTSGLLSTIENIIAGEVIPAKLTTPDPVSVQALLAQMVQKGCTHAFMEASSHALVQGRLNGVDLNGAIFTNISRDHLDYHGTFDNYIAAKKILFDRLGKNAFALVNSDDKRGAVMLQNCRAHTYTYALRSLADFKGKLLSNSFEGLAMEINGTEAWFRLIGDFNAYNLLAVYGAAILLKENEEQVLTVLSGLQPANGRFEQVSGPEGRKAIVDYAHTPDALENVLTTIEQIKQPTQKVITVVGCGGDRDKGKRPQMAAIAAKYSQHLILTSDNPRSEDPAAILEEMLEGLDVLGRGKATVIADRREAIRVATQKAAPHDVLLIAGKGHETYQEIKGQRFHFDDLEEVKAAFNALSN